MYVCIFDVFHTQLFYVRNFEFIVNLSELTYVKYMRVSVLKMYRPFMTPYYSRRPLSTIVYS